MLISTLIISAFLISGTVVSVLLSKMFKDIVTGPLYVGLCCACIGFIVACLVTNVLDALIGLGISLILTVVFVFIMLSFVRWR